jgi:hypothetical protein
VGLHCGPDDATGTLGVTGLAEVGAVLGAAANAGKIAEYAARLGGRGQPQVELDLNVVGMPVATLSERYGVHVQVFVRLRIRNPTGTEARLEDPYLLFRQVRRLGRGRMLARLPLCNNTDGARVEFHEIPCTVRGGPVARGPIFPS